MYCVVIAFVLSDSASDDPSASGSTSLVVAPVGVGVSRTGSSRVEMTNWDAIVGVHGRQRFGEGLRWFVPYYFDVGTGNSNLTTQIMTGIGYSFRWGDVSAAWRYIDYRFKSGDLVDSLSFNGPMVGVAFRF